MSTIFAIIGRILIAVIFLVSGAHKLMDVSGTAAQIAAVGLPKELAIPAGVFEIVAGLCLVLGVFTRLTAILLAGFTLLATLYFHNQISDPAQATNAMKNLAIIGGLFLVFAHSQLWWGFDAFRRRRNEVVRDEAVRSDTIVNEAALDSEARLRDYEARLRDSEARAHEAELRAARLEGLMQGAGTAVDPVRR
ncbi:MAG: DoxX family protein [Novosphingobium sp.]